jgi:hypothetical protein
LHTAAPREVPAATKQVEARPALPAGLAERILAVDGAPPEGAQLLYRPALLGSAQLHYVDKRVGVDHYADVTLLAEPETKAGWGDAVEVDATHWRLAAEPAPGACFAKLPSGLGKGSPAQLERALRAHLQRARPLTLAHCKPLRLVAAPGEAEGAFLVRVRDAQRELRDAKLDELEKRWAPRLARAEGRITTMAEAVERQRSQRSGAVMSTAISVGATVLGALFGRKVGVGTVGRAATAARSASRTAREQGDVGRAEAQLAEAQAAFEELEVRFQEELAGLRDAAADPELEELTLRPRRGDTRVDEVALVWRPYWLGADGLARPAFHEPV